MLVAAVWGYSGVTIERLIEWPSVAASAPFKGQGPADPPLRLCALISPEQAARLGCTEAAECCLPALTHNQGARSHGSG
jgi:hypothetical protein